MSEEMLKSRIDGLEKGQKEVQDDVKLIKENHLVHIQDDITELKICSKEHGTDLKWLKRFFFYIAGATVAGLIAAVLNLMISI